MAELDFQIAGWLGGSDDEPLERETAASLRITAGRDSIPVTEVEDTSAHTVLSHINVSAYSLARWLLVNWWRLRWEPHREKQSYDWLRSHSMAAIGGSYAWPALTFTSDGEFVQLRLESETRADVSAVRYLRNINIDVPAMHFEQAVEKFLDDVEARVALRVPEERELMELRAELRAERRNANAAVECKLQALAGLDPGSASEEWMRMTQVLTEDAGSTAVEEILAVTPELPKGLAAATAVMSALRDSQTTVDLRWAAASRASESVGELPWMRGARLARELRQRWSIPFGPLSRENFEQLIGAHLPLRRASWTGRSQLLGGYRNGVTDGRTAVLMTKEREDSQRFYLARVIAAACVSRPEEHFLAVTGAYTAFQKFERAFAQEFLCPWEALDMFINEHGTDEDAITEAAETFVVSERLVVATLVNKGKASRNRLQEYASEHDARRD